MASKKSATKKYEVTVRPRFDNAYTLEITAKNAKEAVAIVRKTGNGEDKVLGAKKITSNHVQKMKDGRVVEISDKDFQRLGRNKSGRAKVTDLRTGEKVVAKVTSWLVVAA